jgi:ribosome-binding protein aMBF1 (putative translation factor)
MNLEEMQARWDGEAQRDDGDDGEGTPSPKAPEELTEDEQEARQTGVPLAAVKKRNTKPKAKAKAKAVKKPAKKTAKKASKKGAKKVPKAQKPSKAGKKPSVKAKPARSKKNTPATKSDTAKIKKDGTPAKKRGPQGRKNPERNAPDGGKFGRAVARARKEKGWTQRGLAEKAGLTQPAVCNIEKGTAGAGASAARLAKALGLKAA